MHAQRKRGVGFKYANLMTKYFNYLRITKIKIMMLKNNMEIKKKVNKVNQRKK